jgi:DNA-binding PadR family transcriptional regulator
MSAKRIDGFATFPLKQVALGLIVAGPKHGYELYQDFGEAFSPIWRAGQSKFYADLAALQTEGLLDVTTEPQDDRPPRKVYQLTDAGREAFMDWLYEPVTPLRAVRVEFIAKLRFFDLLDLPDADRLIDAQLDVCQRTLNEWVRQADEIQEEQGDAFYELVFDFRRRQARFIIEWLQHCKHQIQAGVTPSQ